MSFWRLSYFVTGVLKSNDLNKHTVNEDLPYKLRYDTDDPSLISSRIRSTSAGGSKINHTLHKLLIYGNAEKRDRYKHELHPRYFRSAVADCSTWIAIKSHNIKRNELYINWTKTKISLTRVSWFTLSWFVMHSWGRVILAATPARIATWSIRISFRERKTILSSEPMLKAVIE